MNKVGYGSRTRVYGGPDAKTSACGAIHDIRKGKKTETLYHIDSEKIVFVLMGQVKLVVVQDGILKEKVFIPGETAYIGRGLAHRFEALEDSMLVEFGDNPAAYRGEDVFVIEKGSEAEDE